MQPLRDPDAAGVDPDERSLGPELGADLSSQLFQQGFGLRQLHGRQSTLPVSAAPPPGPTTPFGGVLGLRPRRAPGPPTRRSAARRPSKREHRNERVVGARNAGSARPTRARAHPNGPATRLRSAPATIPPRASPPPPGVRGRRSR